MVPLAYQWCHWLTNGTIGITIGTNGITNGTIGKTLNDIGISLVTFLLSLGLSSSLLPSLFPIPYYSNSSFSILLLQFPFSHSTGDNPHYWQKNERTQWYHWVRIILARSTIPHFDLSHLTLWVMGSSRLWLKVADEESKSIPHEFPRSHWLKATGQCVMERYLSATMGTHCYFSVHRMTSL